MSIGAAECARRTGLTVRALHVYERHGLIHPKRTAKGWRSYGPAELQQLNVIVTLKTLGMTLTQIRALLATKHPPLERVLQVQLQVCSARREAMEKTLVLVRAALASIGSGRSLSLDELCNLTRSMDAGMENTGGDDVAATVRGLINETLTPEEERDYMNWLASRSSEELKAVREGGRAARVVRRSLQDLHEKKLDPAAPEVQALIVQLNDIGVHYGVLQGQTAMFAWNPSITQKYLEVGARAYWAGMSRAFSAYLRAASAAAPWAKAMKRVVDEATKLVRSKAGPTTPAGRALAKRLGLICSEHSLGDPLAYVRWAPYSPFYRSADEKENKKLASVWEFLATALEVPTSARPNSRKENVLATASSRPAASLHR